jgi:hypothetical protein
LRKFPKTSGIAASPDNPNSFIIGAINLITHGKIGEYCSNATIRVTGKIIFPKVHVVLIPT